MARRDCDVLVIGLGPAGSSAAAGAARAGCSVIGLERKKLIGVPVQCAEFIPLPLARFAQENARAQPIAGMATFLPSGERTERAFGGLMIKRDKFDQALARQAESCGAVLWTDSALRTVDAAARLALASTAGGPREIRYKVLVAADGPASAVAACLGLPRFALVSTRQYTVPLARPHGDTDIWLSPRYPGGYAWLFPKGSVANLGLGLDPALETDMKTPLDELHDVLAAEGRVGREVLLRTGGPIPVGGLRERLVEDRVLFAGDAAGFTHPVTGAGIAPAVASGEAAGAAAAAWLAGDRAALEGYEQEMREQFGPAIERALVARRRMAAVWRSARRNEDSAHRAGWIAFPEYFAKDAT
ncbi:MAG: geranylgeranyl reductase family protein [Betaproteobacteria bacterium]|nr:geranylgeranyl reductase family protein [Betaproteobacteria bacterium]